jgi:hypothetical protein
LKRLKVVAGLHERTASTFRYVYVGVLGALVGFFVGMFLFAMTYDPHHNRGFGLGVAVGVVAGLSLTVGAPVVLRLRDVRAAQEAAEQVAWEYRTELQLLGGASVLRDGLAVQELIRFLDKGGARPAVPADGPGRARVKATSRPSPAGIGKKDRQRPFPPTGGVPVPTNGFGRQPQPSG